MNILLCDDEKSLRLGLMDELCEAGYEVVEAASGEEAIELINSQFFDVVICDLKMKKISGLDVLKYIRKNSPDTGFVLMTAFGTIDSAVEAIKLGAFDYICKPFEEEHLLRIVKNRYETIQLRKENIQLKNMIKDQSRLDQLIGKSQPMLKIYKLIKTVSKTDTTVLIQGDTGTGKQLVAEAIHNNSSRKDNPFITVSCAALPKELFESELFGHEIGAFTGASKQRKGRFELAHTGTLFLDEIDDIPINSQVKLLKAIETAEIERVGGEETLKLDVRIIVATKTDLSRLVDSNLFRKDLYYRLNVIKIDLPLLRDRKEDIPLLVKHFLKFYSPEKPLNISSEIMEILLNYDWKGNVRELKYIIERLVLLHADNGISKSALPLNILNFNASLNYFDWGKNSLPDYLFQIEQTILREAYQRCEGSKSRMSDLLNIPLPTLKSKMKKFNLF